MTKTLKITRIVREPDRTLLYGTDDNYYVIGKKDAKVLIGDEILYEPYGANFGWLIEKE